MEQNSEARMSPQEVDALQRVVTAGKKLMYDEKIFPAFSESLKQDKPVHYILATETSGLMKMLDDKSSGKIPRKVMLPSAVMIMLEIADVMEKGKIAKPSQEDIAKGMRGLALMMGQMFVGQQGKEPAPAQQQAPQTAPGLINGAATAGV